MTHITTLRDLRACIAADTAHSPATEQLAALDAAIVAMGPEGTAAERAEFEGLCSALGADTTPNDACGYANAQVNAAWLGWRRHRAPAQPVADEREAFEAWARALGLGAERTRPDDVAYNDSHSHLAWEGWQARAALAAPQSAAPAALVADLRLAAETLRRYEALHAAKGTDEGLEKARANANLAARFEDTLAGHAPALPLLAPDHQGMRVDYSGMLGQAQRALKIGLKDAGNAELIRQFAGHLAELGQRWYAGDTSAVDEILQIYCIEHDSREMLKAAQRQPSGNAAPDDAMERTLAELVDKVVPGLDTGNMLADAATASKALDRAALAAQPSGQDCLPADPVEAERERFRREDARAVMPLIGPMLDAWDGANPDDREAMMEWGIGRHIKAIYKAITDPDIMPRMDAIRAAAERGIDARATSPGDNAPQSPGGGQAQQVFRWYAVDRDGAATLCINAEDARSTAAEAAQIYPRSAPYIATQLMPVGQYTTYSAIHAQGDGNEQE